jgi:NADPH:quinone reductase-like Zn-dependent oxidoreductase
VLVNNLDWTKTMKRIQYHQYGGPGVMLLEPYQLPAPRKREILVRVKAASINPLDWKLRQGFMKFLVRGSFPRAMGMDFSGVIQSIGPDVTDVAVGEEVLGWTPMTRPGAFAETLITNSDLVIGKPALLPFSAAAALPSVGVTAWRALVDAGRLKAGSSVLINGAAGGVGHAAIAVAKAFGANVSVRVGPRSLPAMAGLGFEHVLDYTKPLPSDLQHVFDIVLDCHGSLTAREERSLIKDSGVAVDVDPTFGNLIRSVISSRHRLIRGLPSQAILQKLVDLAVAGQFPSGISRTASLPDAIALIGDLEAGKRATGKAVIVME